MLLVNAQGLLLTSRIDTATSLNEIFRYHNFLVLVLIVRVNSALASMTLQLQLIELLFWIAQRHRCLARNASSGCGCVFSRILGIETSLAFLVLMLDVGTSVKVVFRDDLSLVYVEVVNNIGNVGDVRIRFGRVGLQVQVFLFSCVRSLCLELFAHVLLTNFLTTLLVGLRGLIFGLRLLCLLFLDPCVDERNLLLLVAFSA